MKKTSSKLIKITSKDGAAALSTEQKKFNRLIRKIEKLQKALDAWHINAPLYLHQYNHELVPLHKKSNNLRIELVLLFDEAYESLGFGRTDQKKLSHFLVTMSHSMLNADDPDPDLKAVFNKHSGLDFDTLVQEQLREGEEDTRQMLEALTGADFSEEDIDLSDPNAFVKAMEQKFASLHRDGVQKKATKKPRKKTAKQLEKEARLAEEEKHLSQSIREVYRQLASSLHPDREPDEAERVRKTELMQRANKAYADGDLLQLLTLQIETEQIDQSGVDTLSEERLMRFNKILTTQAKEIERTVTQAQEDFCSQFPDMDFEGVKPEQLLASLKQEILAMQQEVEGIEQDVADFQSPENIQSFLKTYRISGWVL